MNSQNTKILTFGYGNRKNYDLFIEYLQNYDVKYVVDIRMSPRAWSRKWYGDQIQNFCLSQKINYISKTALGNISGKENWIPPNPEEAEAALHEVAEIARTGTVLLLCAEINPQKCHRTDVAHRLQELVSIPVEHLK